MSGLQTVLWGARGSLPTPGAEYSKFGGNTSCLQLRSDSEPEQCVILDAGSGIRPLGDELVRRSGRLRVTILLTHFHWDHIQGFPYFAPLYRPETEIDIWAHAPVGEIQRLLEAQMASPFFPVPLSALQANLSFRSLAHGASTALGNLRVTALQLRHPQGATGYLIRSGDASLLFATDHECGDAAIDRNLIKTAKGIHHLVIDAQYTAEELRSRVGWGHSSLNQCTAIAAEAGVGQLTLFHHDPRHDDAFLEQMLREAKHEFARSEMAREGMTLC